MIRLRLIGPAGVFGAAALLLAVELLPLALGDRALAGGENQKSAAASRPFGIEKRVPWMTSNFRGRPEPPLPYRAERVFPKVHFKNPTVLTSAPGTDRLFVAEQYGKIYSILNDREATAPDLFLDTQVLVERIPENGKEGLALEAVYGMTFHPKFAENRYCYVCYVVRYRDGGRGQYPQGTRVSRFTVSRTDPPRCEIASEKLIISWLQGGHNGGCLKFGPDGCLYISSGDGGGAFPPDPLKAGQDVTNVLSAIMRIDVDHAPEGKGYAIPPDNPFVSLKDARGEVWAYGLRNPWKMSFDRKAGDLWVGDVGWELWEMVYRVRKADNYGWSLYEGPQPVHTERPRGPTPIVPPTIEIPHTEGASVTGGFVYRGKKFPKLVGTYVFGDWETRRIWGATVDGDSVGPKGEIMDPTVRVVDFAEDNEGELYLLDYDAGTIHAVVENQVKADEHVFPRTLRETGIFASVAKHTPAPGVLPFSINAPQWSDGALAERFVGVPGAGTVHFSSEPKPVPGSMFTRRIEFPENSVLVKTLSLELERGNPASRRRVETQVLHFDGRDWRGYTYEWNDDQTDAVLVEGEGKTRVVLMADAAAPGGKRQQSWHFPSRTECLRCHNPWSENALSFNIPQLNREHDFGGITDYQIRTFRHIGLVEELPGGERSVGTAASRPPAKSPEQLPRYVDPYDATAEINERGRTYLHINCAHCHRNGGGGSAYVHLPYDIPLNETRSLGVRPSQGTFGIHDARIIAPGDPFRSVLYFRMAKLGPGHMPHIGTSVVDQRGLSLIHDWIRQLPPRLDDQMLIDRLAGLDQDELEKKNPQRLAERQQLIDELLGNSSRATLLALALHQNRVAESTREAAVAAAVAHADAAIRDLFEPFVPEEQRLKRLGDSIKSAELLKLAGDVAHGKDLFHKTAGVQCRNCHRIAGDGTELGPDLSQIGKKLDRAKLLESILEPSRNIEPQFVTWVVETTAGKVVTGILVRKDETEMIVKDAQNKQHRLLMSEVEGAHPQQKSLMPELLLREMTAQQVADLLAYLASLK
jgi:putative heme-binding domain-containing protein